MTILMAHALVVDTWGTCIIATTSHVGRIYSESKTEPNIPEFRPDCLFLRRQRSFERSTHYFIKVTGDDSFAIS